MNYDTNKNPVEVAGSVTNKQDSSKINTDKEKVQNKENLKKETETVKKEYKKYDVKKEYKKYDESSEMYPDLGRQIVEVIVLFVFVMMTMFFISNIDVLFY